MESSLALYIGLGVTLAGLFWFFIRMFLRNYGARKELKRETVAIVEAIERDGLNAGHALKICEVIRAVEHRTGAKDLRFGIKITTADGRKRTIVLAGE